LLGLDIPPKRPNNKHKLDFLKKPPIHIEMKNATKKNFQSQTVNLSDIGKPSRFPKL
jgi:hypothetical protein